MHNGKKIKNEWWPSSRNVGIGSQGRQVLRKADSFSATDWEKGNKELVPS